MYKQLCSKHILRLSKLYFFILEVLSLGCLCVMLQNGTCGSAHQCISAYETTTLKDSKNEVFFWSVFSCIWTEYGRRRTRKKIFIFKKPEPVSVDTVICKVMSLRRIFVERRT